MVNRMQFYIDGAWVDAASGSILRVDDPANGHQLGSVPNAGRDETRDAIAAAAAAFAALIDAWFRTGTGVLVAPPNTVVPWS